MVRFLSASISVHRRFLFRCCHRVSMNSKQKNQPQTRKSATGWGRLIFRYLAVSDVRRGGRHCGDRNALADGNRSDLVDSRHGYRGERIHRDGSRNG